MTSQEAGLEADHSPALTPDGSLGTWVTSHSSWGAVGQESPGLSQGQGLTTGWS